MLRRVQVEYGKGQQPFLGVAEQTSGPGIRPQDPSINEIDHQHCIVAALDDLRVSAQVVRQGCRGLLRTAIGETQSHG
ncbi:MAG: hypothetical protein IPI55_10735 [Flavobacteriales bacterium]|nr:hypothetical protein [Flavobacteriales bacterium]